jgi:formylglycine-generating enzyme required for sulfatase activity
MRRSVQSFSTAGICLGSVLVLALFCHSAYAAMAIRVPVTDEKGVEGEMELYGGSHALIIGASAYRAGWPSLESIPGELDNVEDLLTRQGFKVERVADPDSQQLKDAFTGFINRHGYDRNNRLLIFYSGHGYTRQNGTKGYLVPVDAPDPDKDEKGFLTKALGMNHILSWARDIEAKHVLFMFDSCFSGTIFKQRDRPKPPKHITSLTAQPVRQFITAGQAGESVPANSTFTPMFIDALKFGIGDLNRDGYVSGTELGLYLQEKVPLHANQSPQFGKIQDYDLSRGDFIFVAGEPPPVAEETSAAPSSESPGMAYREPATGMEFVWVEGGCFQMGQTAREKEQIVAELGEEKYNRFFHDELPVHEVCVDGFWMGKYEVTQGQWQKIMGNNPSGFKAGDDFPVEQVSWNDVQEFIRLLNREGGKSFRLPTEAEWEYAARGNERDEIFSGGNDVDTVAWYGGNSGKATHRVGTKKPNRLGLHDMSGNVWEWCADWYYDKYYAVSPRNNPEGAPSGTDRVGRGGAWGDSPSYVRVSYRDWTGPDKRDPYLGFRLTAPGK